MSNLRHYGVNFGILPTTPNNHIADIEGLEIGHYTLHQGKNVHTGITLVRPHGRNVVENKAFAAFYRGNGYGKFAGSTQVEELGTIESYLGLTNTLAVGTVVQELVKYHINAQNDPGLISLNVVVGETNDAYLNDIASFPIKPEYVKEAIDNVGKDNYIQGSIGAGAGTCAFGFKAGIGSSSRIIPRTWTKSRQDYKFGVLLQANYGGFLTLQGVPIWKELCQGRYPFNIQIKLMEQAKGSCVIFIATDAPLLPMHLKRLAKRSVAALVRTGSFLANQSGDYALAWSTHKSAASSPSKSKRTARRIQGEFLGEESLDAFFLATMEATEEALWNSMTHAETVDGFRGKAEAIPIQNVLDIVKKHKFDISS